MRLAILVVSRRGACLSLIGLACERRFSAVLRITGRRVVDGLLLVGQVGLGLFRPVADKGALLAENECVVDALYLVECVLFFVLIPAVRSRIIQVLRLDIRVFRLGGVFINFSITYLEKSASCYQHQKIRKAANLFPRFRYWHVG
jgi:hypothetical protein